MTYYYQNSQVIEAMTIPFTVTIASTNDKEGKKLCQDTTPKIEEELKRIERDYSAFCDNSLVSRFGNGESSILLSHLEFQEIYKQVTAASKATNGIFDPYFSGKYNPTGYVKGWAIEKCYQDFLAPLLSRDAIVGVYLNGGGDIQCGIQLYSGFQWTVGVENPDKLNEVYAIYNLENSALATSGYSKRGKHVVSKDITLQQVTVQHEHLATADVWATTLLAAPAESRTTLLSNYHLNAVLIFEDRKEVYQNGEKKDVQKI
ncbi:FAD:protein FMN transferase [Streptococcus infantarius]|uniref:FAD:protein FMN transferase n=1 Tax=Streptococcus infantarius TaxID=102684 RepID=UPI0022E97A39|nr:FAD:protein FMN transferase [Streptococcus infantarius]